MEKIASFCVDHTKLDPGIYLSRVDGDIATYDLRFKNPNCPPFLSVPAMYTIEHLFATFARNSQWKDRVIYFGPMGCCTGFYLLLRGMKHTDAIALIQDMVKQAIEFTGDIPGVSEVECGNYMSHDLETAKKECVEYEKIIRNWTEQQLQYQE